VSGCRDVFSAEDDTAQAGLRSVIVDGNSRIIQEAPEPLFVVECVTERLTQAAARPSSSRKQRVSSHPITGSAKIR
jgi:hypothetical protein